MPTACHCDELAEQPCSQRLANVAHHSLGARPVLMRNEPHNPPSIAIHIQREVCAAGKHQDQTGDNAEEGSGVAGDM